MSGVFITLEGTEGSGKSTQIALLAERLRSLGKTVRTLREPGGTPLAEEIRHLLKHHAAGRDMTAEAELLLMNAARAQLVREVIRPALAAGEVVLCDRFYDSTTAYQGHGRGLDLEFVRHVVDYAVGGTRPHLTLLLMVPLAVSEMRRLKRQGQLTGKIEQEIPTGTIPYPTDETDGRLLTDRFEQANREFFQRVEAGYRALAAAEPQRVRMIDAARGVEEVRADIWRAVEPVVTVTR
ncbi:MAG: dTMP kinase [Verrucomicrobia bacterium]|nr:dTMP kinase [Verrucomicrobiota bacterium]